MSERVSCRTCVLNPFRAFFRQMLFKIRVPHLQEKGSFVWKGFMPHLRPVSLPRLLPADAVLNYGSPSVRIFISFRTCAVSARSGFSGF